MRWINRAIAVAAVLTVSAIGVWAQDQCTEDYLNETYTKWYEPYSHRDTDPKQKDMAYEIAKEYVGKCPSQFPDSPYAKALKSYVQVYEKAQATGKVGADFTEAIKKQNYSEILRTGKAYVATDPNNSTAFLWMGFAGLNDQSLLSDAAQYAPKAIELVEGGKSYEPFKSKDEAIAAMNHLIAKSKAASAPNDAIPYFIKAAKVDSKNAQIYSELAAAYGEQVDKLTKDYQSYIGKPETTESKLLLANLNQAIDAQIDAYARATAASTNPADKKNLMDALTELYKFRNKTATDAEVTQLVASILNKPLPDAPKPITELPTTPAPTTTPGGTNATPTNGSGSAPANTAGGSAPKPAGAGTTSGSNKPATSGSTTPAKPTATPTPRPRQRANHRG